MSISISFLFVYLLTSMSALEPAIMSSTPSITGACEPSGQLDVSARVISKNNLGAKKRIVVELKIQPKARIPSVRIGGAVKNAMGVHSVPEKVVHLTGNATRKVRYTFDLDQGREHHLTFSIQSGSEPVIRTDAYLRINLDPNLEPVDLNDVLQFRAVSAAEVAQ